MFSDMMMGAAMASSETLNPSDKAAGITLTNGNLRATGANVGGVIGVRSLTGITSGKWYWETQSVSGSGNAPGVCTSTANLGVLSNVDAGTWVFYDALGKKYNNATFTDYGPSWSSANRIGTALDADAGKLWWHVDGVYPGGGDPATGANPAFTGLSGVLYPCWFDVEGASAPVIDFFFMSSLWLHASPSGFAQRGG